MVYGMKEYRVKVTRIGFRLWLRVKSLGFRISDSGSGLGLDLSVYDLRFKVQG
jgi:tRNA U34 5-carboxymethylaminomethyl modifying enzyme MnmG/GidA